MHPLDIFIILIYVGFALWTGFHSKEESSKNLEEYFLAGRSLKGWQSGLSMAAAQFAADTPLLVTGLIATAGIFSLWRLWIYAFAFLLLGFLLGGAWRRAGVITDAELTEVRYGQGPAIFLRGFKAVYLGTVFNCTVLAMVLFAATRICEPFLTWHLWLPEGLMAPVIAVVKAVGTPLSIHRDSPDVWALSADNLISIVTIAGITTFYSTTGGLRNVVKMDIFQFFIKMLGTAVYAWFIVMAVGGLPQIPIKLQAMFASGGPGGMTPDQILAFTPGEAKDATAMVITLFMVQWIAQMNADGSGYLAQRTMACRSEKDAKQAAIIFTVVQVILRTLLWLPIGLGLLILFQPDPSLAPEFFVAERESTYVSGMAVLPPGLKGIMITAMLAALGSTVDTHVNWGSSYWTNDIFKRIICEKILGREPDGKALVWVARGSNIAILLLSLYIMTRLDSIQEGWQNSLMLGAGLGIVLVLRWVWWRMNAWGELASIIASLLLAMYFWTVNPFAGMPAADAEALRLIVMATIATTVSVGVALLVGPEDMELLKNFYKKAKPPGFWGPVAEACGEAPNASARRFYRSMAAVFLAGLSVFCVMTAVGTWMIGAPPPALFKDMSWLWIVLLLLLGFGVVPVWWKLVFDEDEDLTPVGA